ncbi:MAG TPA: TetR/AcrR family transcriptional regulator [Myxococcota bacterium]
MERVNPTGHRGRPRSEESRQAILEATRALLTEQGYEQLAIHVVAEAAGVGRQTVYRWWPTKAALVATAVLEGFVDVPDFAPPSCDDDPRAVLLRWLSTLAAHYRQPAMAALMRALTAASTEDPEVAARLSAQLLDPFRAHIASLLSPRCPDDARARVVADALIGALFLRVIGHAELQTADISMLIALLPRDDHEDQTRR